MVLAQEYELPMCYYNCGEKDINEQVMELCEEVCTPDESKNFTECTHLQETIVESGQYVFDPDLNACIFQADHENLLDISATSPYPSSNRRRLSERFCSNADDCFNCSSRTA